MRQNRNKGTASKWHLWSRTFFLWPSTSPSSPSPSHPLHACMLILRRQHHFILPKQQSPVYHSAWSLKCYIWYYKPEIKQYELHSWLQMVAVAQAIPFDFWNAFEWVSLEPPGCSFCSQQCQEQHCVRRESSDQLLCLPWSSSSVAFPDHLLPQFVIFLPFIFM